MNYWMLTISPENYQVTREQGFTVQGFRSPDRKKVDRMQPGDRLLFYVKGQQRFACVASVTSTAFVDQQYLWRWIRPEEKFAHRVYIRPDVVLENEDHVDANQLAPRLDYVRKWRPEDWPLAFEAELHLLPKKDFQLIEDEMKRVSSPH